MVKQNYPKKRDGSDRGGRRNAMPEFGKDTLRERNDGRFRRSTAEKVAEFWPLAIVPSLLATCGLWRFFVIRERIPWRVAVLAVIATAFVLNSLFTIWFYKEDKRLAEQKLRRIPEFHLHFWELVCGWPGALFAQRRYHHKWCKTSYMVVFLLCVLLNLALLFGLIFPGTVKTVLADLMHRLR